MVLIVFSTFYFLFSLDSRITKRPSCQAGTIITRPWDWYINICTRLGFVTFRLRLMISFFVSVSAFAIHGTMFTLLWTAFIKDTSNGRNLEKTTKLKIQKNVYKNKGLKSKNKIKDGSSYTSLFSTLYIT